MTTVVSIDKETSLPIQMKMTFDALPYTTIADQFVFDQPLDPELFALTAPEGYKMTAVEYRDPVDDSDLEFSPGESFGPATFGMTVEQVIEVLGQPDQNSGLIDTLFMDITNDPDPADVEDPLKLLQDWVRKACTLNYASRGFALVIDEDRGLISVQCFGTNTGERMFSGQISGGIRMGDSSEAVQRVMGKPTREPNLELGEEASDLNYTLPNGSTLQFTFENSKLVSVTNRKAK